VETHQESRERSRPDSEHRKNSASRSMPTSIRFSPCSARGAWTFKRAPIREKCRHKRHACVMRASSAILSGTEPEIRSWLEDRERPIGSLFLSRRRNETQGLQLIGRCILYRWARTRHRTRTGDTSRRFLLPDPCRALREKGCSVYEFVPRFPPACAFQKWIVRFPPSLRGGRQTCPSCRSEH